MNFYQLYVEYSSHMPVLFRFLIHATFFGLTAWTFDRFQLLKKPLPIAVACFWGYAFVFRTVMTGLWGEQNEMSILLGFIISTILSFVMFGVFRDLLSENRYVLREHEMI